MAVFGTHTSTIQFVGKDGGLTVTDYADLFGPGSVNITVTADGTSNLSLNLTAEKAVELHSALGRLVNTLPQTWADAQAELLVLT